VFVGITNTPRDYAWGSNGAISGLLGTAATGAPEAELWLGAHPGSPSRIVDPSVADGRADLAAWIAADPDTAIGVTRPSGEPRLPFLLKVLAAASPLSLQAHPTAEQAAAGFADEDARGVPSDAPTRNYKDAFPKPEIIYALEDGFRALCGFRPLEETHTAIGRLVELDNLTRAAGDASLQRWLEATVPGSELRPVFEWLITRGDGVDELISRVVTIAQAHPDEFGTLVSLAQAYPGDPGILISLMLNEVTLKRGEVLYLPAGNIHAYLSGIGIELMVASDNVLRGGLTPKHVDVPELLSVLDFDPVGVPLLTARRVSETTRVFAPGAGFELIVIDGESRVDIVGPAIVLCTSGTFSLAGSKSRSELAQGQAVYVTPDESSMTIAGGGLLFVATTSND
jgi:mannose-6-phosphate isomerase